MAKPPTMYELEFEKATRDWIVGQVGLSGFYEISRIKKFESAGLSHDKSSLPVEFAAILSVMRQAGRICTIPPKTRKDFDALLYRERQTRDLRMEGEKTLLLESEGERRLSRYSKLFKIFPHSERLSDFDTRIFSSLYDRLRHSVGGNHIGQIFFQKIEGKTERGHKLVAYLFSDDPDRFSGKPSSALSDSSVPKRIFVTINGELHEKDSLLASVGMLKMRKARVSHQGIALSRH